MSTMASAFMNIILKQDIRSYINLNCLPSPLHSSRNIPIACKILSFVAFAAGGFSVWIIFLIDSAQILPLCINIGSKSVGFDFIKFFKLNTSKPSKKLSKKGFLLNSELLINNTWQISSLYRAYEEQPLIING